MKDKRSKHQRVHQTSTLGLKTYQINLNLFVKAHLTAFLPTSEKTFFSKLVFQCYYLSRISLSIHSILGTLGVRVPPVKVDVEESVLARRQTCSTDVGSIWVIEIHNQGITTVMYPDSTVLFHCVIAFHHECPKTLPVRYVTGFVIDWRLETSTAICGHFGPVGRSLIVNTVVIIGKLLSHIAAIYRCVVYALLLLLYTFKSCY